MPTLFLDGYKVEVLEYLHPDLVKVYVLATGQTVVVNQSRLAIVQMPEPEYQVRWMMN